VVCRCVFPATRSGQSTETGQNSAKGSRAGFDKASVSRYHQGDSAKWGRFHDHTAK
jgi:hypothetical protein